MITLALDTATDRLTVAATDGETVAHRVLDGSRRHAGAVLGLLDAVLRELGATPHDVGRLVTGDGPGSFTGLRVAASVAKAMVWRREFEWFAAPSLLMRAAAHAPARGGRVLALSDALRGELYAGCWQFAEGWRTGAPGAIVAVGHAPRAMRPADLAAFGTVDVVVGTVPPALAGEVEQVTRCGVIAGEAALPDARNLLVLATIPGGTTFIPDADAWEPEYGRPAEAQVAWERTHGQRLPDTPGLVR